MTDREALNNKLKFVAEEIKKRDNFGIVANYDADGLSGGAIIAKALEREGKKWKAIAIKQLYKETLEEIKGLGENYIFVDLGSSYVNELKQEFKENFFVFDHHQTTNDSENHVNASVYGFDGGREISGSGTSYLFAKTLNQENVDLADLAIVGAVGDIQDSSGRVIGLNKEIKK